VEKVARAEAQVGSEVVEAATWSLLTSGVI
jgi:hypothetical protein